MEIRSLDTLKQDINGVYDLYSPIQIDGSSVGVYNFYLSSRHDMRIDLVCYDIYGHTNNIDILTNLNNVLNVFSIQSGDVLLFVSDDDVDKVRKNIEATINLIKQINKSNSGKQTKQDNNRANDVRDRAKIEQAKTFIPPNIIQSTTNVEIGDGKITFKPNF